MSSSSSSSSAPSRLSHLTAIYGADVVKLIQAARVLVVGAGGIGCELLKNLVLSGYQDIVILDLDTIDVSNLNRQFLFRKQHVGMSKAKIARESVLAFNPHVKIEAIHGNIKDPEYDVDYFSRFTLVMNALDNVAARRHVNRLCISANKPLLESGTQGYLGQAFAIFGGKTECFECQPQAAPKTYAVCTIRNTPELPVHCIVWAKAVYAALFGEKDENNMLSDVSMDIDDANNGRVRASTLRIIERLFDLEIEQQLAVAERWKNRRAPQRLDVKQLLQQLGFDYDTPLADMPSLQSLRNRDQQLLSTAETLVYLILTIEEIITNHAAAIGTLTFDKDDDLSMDFVCSSANLRMVNFHITPLTRFASKGVAGNIIHAVATTNAIAAGLMVIDSIKILRGQLEQCKLTWISPRPPMVLTPQEIMRPNKNCYVCGQQQIELRIDTNKFTLKQLYENVLKKKISMNDPSIDVINRDNFIGTQDDHESSDNDGDNSDADADDDAKSDGEGEGVGEGVRDYLSQPLSSPGIRIDHGALLAVDDQTQHFNINIRIVQREFKEEENPDEFEIVGDITKQSDGEKESDEEKKSSDTATTASTTSSSSSKQSTTIDHDDFVVSDSPIPSSAKPSTTSTSAVISTSTSLKRKLDESSSDIDEQSKQKQTKTQAAAGADDEVITLD